MNKIIPITIASVVGTGGGFAIGYFMGKKRNESFYRAELGDLRVELDNLARATKTGVYSTIESAHEAVMQTPVSDIRSEPTDDEASVSNVEARENVILPIPSIDETEASKLDAQEFIERFKNRASEEYGGVTFPGSVDSVDEDTADEPVSSTPGFTTVRDPNGPYVISIDEYMEDTGEAFTKVELTYFEGDEVLIDASEVPIGNMKDSKNKIDDTVGLKNLNKWGIGTTDPEQVYIRNERLAIDIELTRDDNTYTRSVLGIKTEDEVARSMTKPLKMREGDGN